MRLGYELPTVPLCLPQSVLHGVSTTEAARNILAVAALSWSSLYIVQDPLLLNNPLVITE